MTVGTGSITVEEFDQMAELPANAARRLEYVGGEIVELVSNNYASAVASKINFFIQLYLTQHPVEGYVTGADGGYQVTGERYIPDVAFIAKSRQPALSHDTYNPNPPDLAVEVMSPTDRADELRLKVANYLTAGTTVWVVAPETKTVEVYTPGQRAYRVNIEHVLDGGDILPGLQIAVADIFPE